LPEPLGPSRATTIIVKAHLSVNAFYCVKVNNRESRLRCVNTPSRLR